MPMTKRERLTRREMEALIEAAESRLAGEMEEELDPAALESASAKLKRRIPTRIGDDDAQ